MKELLANAENILETALAGEGEVSILIGHDGAIRIMADTDWPLDSLQNYHGTREAYRVRRMAGRVRVEGKSAKNSCLLESEPPARTAHFLLADRTRSVIAA